MEDQQPLANNTIDIEDVEDEDHHQYFDGQRIHRVHKLVRFNRENKEDYYAPKMVSFGPYYHGLQDLGMAEKLKHEVPKMHVSNTGRDEQFFYRWIFKVIDHIRNCYVGISRDAYNDGTLTEMILLDASFVIYLMKAWLGEEEKYTDHFIQHFGVALAPFALQDLHLLDNQIPVWVIELLNRLIYGKKEEEPRLVWNFLKNSLLMDSVHTTGEDKMQPLHLVGAIHQLLVEEWDNAGKRTSSNCLKNIKFKSECQWWPRRKENPSGYGEYNRQSHSVTDLKAKGIHFKPSSYCLTDIKFESQTFYGQLQLPIRIFTPQSKQFFEQMIAYEASPERNIGTPIVCYVNFLKSLIVKSEDVNCEKRRYSSAALTVMNKLWKLSKRLILMDFPMTTFLMM